MIFGLGFLFYLGKQSSHCISWNPTDTSGQLSECDLQGGWASTRLVLPTPQPLQRVATSVGPGFSAAPQYGLAFSGSGPRFHGPRGKSMIRPCLSGVICEAPGDRSLRTQCEWARKVKGKGSLVEKEGAASPR